MVFHIHRAARTDLLADGLGELLATPQPDPFAEELVLVPARGIERWLSQRLSHRLGRGTGADGVCAGVSFRSPHSLIAELTGTADTDPWSPDSLVWPLLEVIDASADEPWCTRLAAHLGHHHSGAEAELRFGRRHAVARRIAALFGSYAAQRPRLLTDWLAGDDTDGLGADLDPDLGWQPALWRRLVSRVPADPPHIRHARTVAALRSAASDLPPRLSLFGQNRLPATDIELLEALSTHHDVHLWIPHPSDALWRRLAGARDRVPRRTVPDDDPGGHPLLTTLGRDVRELQRLLPETAVEGAIDCATTYPDTLLGWLQSDIAADTVRPAGRELPDEDRSMQVHSCHGPARQIDVLRDVLLGLLADDPTLEPRDILVMCPDIDTYAPLIIAGFGLGESGDGHPAHRLRVRLADRALTQTNPLLAATAQLLALVGGRATASEVLNFAEMGPVRARFGFSDDDLDVVNGWVRESGIRWGFDRDHRSPFGLETFVHNTWRFGLDRVLCGVAMSDDSQGWLQTTLPLDDVSSNQVELAGRFAEFVDRLQWSVDSLSGAHALAEWMDLLRDGVERLTRVGAADGWQSGQLQREFADIVAAAGEQSSITVRLSDIRSLLTRRLAGRPTRANFRSGSLTVCTMVPMRSVPHRVVCLVGLDDGVFPRVGAPDGDDVLGRDPVVGERDIRSEDRQLLLDAIGAATEKLVITYTGADEYSGHRHPPCVPLAEVLDAVDRTTPSPVRDTVVISHPLQPFDVRNVRPGALGTAPQTPFTFDVTALVAAQAASRPEPAPQRDFLSAALPPRDTGDVGLEELLAFFNDPVKGFFRGFAVALPSESDVVDDSIPVEIDALTNWAVGNRMLEDLLRGHDPQWALEAEWRRGQLPPGQLGWRIALQSQDLATQLVGTAAGYRTGTARSVDVDVDLGSGRRLTGTVTGVHGNRHVAVSYSKLAAKHLLQSWIRLLALCAAEPGADWTAVSIGRRGRTGVGTRAFGPPARPAGELLAELVAIYDAGLREPLPVPLKTSYAWAEARHHRSDPLGAAEDAWRTGNFPENAEDAHVRAWGADAPLGALTRPPAPGEEIPGESTRIGALAARVWAPLLAAEREVGG
jgi:exodeoxyribonuclease V gamma subunit